MPNKLNPANEEFLALLNSRLRFERDLQEEISYLLGLSFPPSFLLAETGRNHTSLHNVVN